VRGSSCTRHGGRVHAGRDTFGHTMPTRLVQPRPHAPHTRARAFRARQVYEVGEEVVLSQPAYLCFYARESWWASAPALAPRAHVLRSALGDARAVDAAGEGGWLGPMGRRLWFAANVTLLACCACVARSQLELLTAETRWGAARLGELSSEMRMRLWWPTATPSDEQGNASYASAGHVGWAHLPRFEQSAGQHGEGAPSAPLQQLGELSEGLGPMLLLVLLANFSLKHVLGSLPHLAPFRSSARGGAGTASREPYGYGFVYGS